MIIGGASEDAKAKVGQAADSGLNGKRLKGSNMRKVIFAIVIMAVSTAAAADQRINMYVGEIKLMRLSPIERVAVGQSAILSTSLLQNGQLLLLGEGEGTTNVHLWFENGKEDQYTVTIFKEDQQNTAQILNSLLSGIPGVEAEVVGDQVLLRGDVPPEYDPVVTAVIAKYPGVINVTSKTANVVRQLLSDVDGITVSTVGSHVVLRGDIHVYEGPGDRENYQQVSRGHGPDDVGWDTGGPHDLHACHVHRIR